MIYFIKNTKQDTIKIGYTKKFTQRMQTLQTASPDKLVCLLLIDGGNKLENELHMQFASDHVGGEWFTHSVAIDQYIADRSNDHIIIENDSPQLHLKPSKHEFDRIEKAHAVYCDEQRVDISLNQYVIRLIEIALEQEESTT